VGLYFDGVQAGYDCSCCGSRWSRQYSYDGDDTPMVYGDPVLFNLGGNLVLVVFANGEQKFGVY